MTAAAFSDYRLGVGIVLLDSQRRVFLAQRIDTPSDSWQMPQGGMHKGEAPRDAAARELFEETAVRSWRFLAESQEWLHYDFPPELRAKLWRGRYRGQRQKWFALLFTGQDTDIQLDGPHPEFSAWRWSDPMTLVDHAIEFKKPLYRKIQSEFAPYFRP